MLDLYRQVDDSAMIAPVTSANRPGDDECMRLEECESRANTRIGSAMQHSDGVSRGLRLPDTRRTRDAILLDLANAA